MNKKLLFGLGWSIVAATPVFVIVSCSDSISTTFGNVREVSFGTKVNKLTRSNGIIIEAKVYDANNNENAKKLLQGYVDNLSVKQLNRDFTANPQPRHDRDEADEGILTQFYQILENESKDVEIEVKKIKVKSKNADGSFQILVTMEVEKDTRDNEKLETKEIKWTPKLTLLSKDAVDKIKKETNGFTEVQTPDGQEIDLSDLKELFLGETDDDNDDEKGIFDILAQINNKKDNLGFLVAYELTLNDLKPAFDLVKPGARTAIDVNTKFLVPSISLNTNESIVLTPDETPQINVPTTSTTLDAAGLDNLIKQYPNPVDRVDSTTNQPNANFTTLLSNFVKDTSNLKLDNVQSIQIMKDSATSKYVFLITYTNSKQMPDAFVITPSGQTPSSITVTPKKDTFKTISKY